MRDEGRRDPGSERRMVRCSYGAGGEVCRFRKERLAGEERDGSMQEAINNAPSREGTAGKAIVISPKATSSCMCVRVSPFLTQVDTRVTFRVFLTLHVAYRVYTMFMYNNVI